MRFDLWRSSLPNGTRGFHKCRHQQNRGTLSYWLLYTTSLWPAKTPAPIIKKLEEALKKTVQDKEAREKMEKMEYRIDFLNAKDTQAFLEAETKKWSAVVKKANIVVK